MDANSGPGSKPTAVTWWDFTATEGGERIEILQLQKNQAPAA